MGSNKSYYSSKGNEKRFMLESLNRLMDDLGEMDEGHDRFVTDVIKEEPKDYFIEEISRIKQEDNVYDQSTSEVLVKQELDEFTVDYGNVLPEDIYDEPPLHFITEIIVKKEDHDLDYQFINCLEDLRNKNLRIVLRRFKCYMCEHCPLFYITKQTLVRHIHTKHFLLFQNSSNISKSSISCVICDKKLSYKSWHEHMTVVHSEDKFSCELCHKVFKHKYKLKRHVQRIHERRKPTYLHPSSPVECPLCFKMFTNKHSLHTHNKTCHSEQTYTCKVCNSTLKCKTYLNVHMRRVHYDDGKKHVCDICTKNFKSPRYLKIHKKNAHYSL